MLTLTARTIEGFTGGTGYTAGDVITISGGTSTVAAQITLDLVDGSGVPQQGTVTTAGSYSVIPAAPAATTGGTGAGLTVTIGWTIATTSVTVAGSGYAVYPPPLVTSPTITPYWTRLEIVPTMTPASATLSLNPSGGSITLGPVYTVATLPTVGTKGQRAFVSDANATTFQTIVAGGGANNVPVFDDGTNWRIG